MIVFLRHTGNRGFLRRLQGLIDQEVKEKSTSLDPQTVPTAGRERWLDGIIQQGCRVLLGNPKAVQTGLNNLTAFHSAIWYAKAPTTTPALPDKRMASESGDGFAFKPFSERRCSRSRPASIPTAYPCNTAFSMEIGASRSLADLLRGLTQLSRRLGAS